MRKVIIGQQESWVAWGVDKLVSHKRHGSLDEVLNALLTAGIEAEVKHYSLGEDLKSVSGKVYMLDADVMKTSTGINMVASSEGYLKTKGINLVGDKKFRNAIMNEAPYLFYQAAENIPNSEKGDFGVYIVSKSDTEGRSGDYVFSTPTLALRKGVPQADKKGNLQIADSVGQTNYSEILPALEKMNALDSEKLEKMAQSNLGKFLINDTRRRLFAYKVMNELNGYDSMSLENAFAKFMQAHPDGEVTY